MISVYVERSSSMAILTPSCAEMLIRLECRPNPDIYSHLMVDSFPYK